MTARPTVVAVTFGPDRVELSWTDEASDYRESGMARQQVLLVPVTSAFRETLETLQDQADLALARLLRRFEETPAVPVGDTDAPAPDPDRPGPYDLPAELRRDPRTGL